LAGGYFSQIGGVTANNIAVWDGATWHPLGSGMTGSFHEVFDFLYDDSVVYVGGAFTAAGGVPAMNIATLVLPKEYTTVVMKGNVYYDSAADCKFTSPEDYPLSSVLVKAEPGPYYAIPDANGDYAFTVDTGTYTLTVLPEQYMKQVCPAG